MAPAGQLADASLAHLLTARFVIVTGKGGVGKTTVAAAIALVAAAQGKRVLAAEVGTKAGTPSPLIDVLTGRREIATSEPVEVLPGIDAVLLTPETGHRAFLRDALPFGFLADRALKTEPVKRFLAAAPAFAELGVLYHGLQLLKAERKKGVPKWDLMVLDSPATGHAIAFASLPDVVLKLIPVGPINRAVREGSALLTDPKRTIALVTTLPEALPVSEALELVAGLEKHRLHVSGVIVNLIPVDPFSPAELQALSTYVTPATAGATVLGTQSLGRLRRATVALRRLKDGAGRTLYSVREQLVRGPSLVEAVASELASTT
jgi:arsenite-transporting ATPase